MVICAVRDNVPQYRDSGVNPLSMYMLLTYMATIENVVAAQILHLFELPTWESRLPLWSLYVSNDLIQWTDTKAELNSPDFSRGGRTLREHLLQTLCDFRCSKRPPAGDLRRMTPNDKGVWKMHPSGLRIYGWSPAPRTFAMVTGALEIETKQDKGLNDRKMQEVLDFIRAHDLEATIVKGNILDVFPIDG